MPIPIIGQPIEVMLQEVYAVAICNCNPDKAERTILMLLQSRTVFCGQCNTGYVLQASPNLTLNIQTVKQGMGSV